jgi:hypothetical protein
MPDQVGCREADQLAGARLDYGDRLSDFRRGLARGATGKDEGEDED